MGMLHYTGHLTDEEIRKMQRQGRGQKIWFAVLFGLLLLLAAAKLGLGEQGVGQGAGRKGVGQEGAGGGRAAVEQGRSS